VDRDILGDLGFLLVDLVQEGGPMPTHYAEFNRLTRQLGDHVRAGLVPRKTIVELTREWAAEHWPDTLQAKAVFQKHGYSGDFEIIDDIYATRITSDPQQRRWDLYFHAQAAPCAVRNRKAYFLDLLRSHGAYSWSKGEQLEVLNIASGPARDVREWFQSEACAPTWMDCVDMDPNAVAFAKKLCGPFSDHLHFHERNVLRFLPSRGYDLVWSSGLFDYLSDRVFVHLLKSMLAVCKPGGEVVVGNFSDFNPSRDYMELFGNWCLEHRSREKLFELAERAGAIPDQTRIEWEPEGVNLFLHIRR
jgi:SAM-dependent methyltransferase